MSFSLADQLLINKGDDSKDFNLSRLYHFWLYPLENGSVSPPLISISATPTSSGTTNLILEAQNDITLYRYRVLRFGSKFAVVKRTVTLTANTPLPVPIFALPTNIDSLDPPCVTHPLIPLMSVKEGGFPQPSANLAEAHNKNMSLYSVSQKYKHDTTSTVTGELNFTDPALPILEEMENKGLTNIFVQVFPVITQITSLDDYRQQGGVLAVQYFATATVSVSDPESGFVAFSMELNVNGQIDNYLSMFPLPAIITPVPPLPPVGFADLFLTFHDGSFADLTTPSRLITLDANAYVGYPSIFGAKYANTSLVANSRVQGTGCTVSDLAGLTDIGGSGVNYCVECFVSGLSEGTRAEIILQSGTNTVFRIAVNISGGAPVTVNFHDRASFSMTAAAFSSKSMWNHFAGQRIGNDFYLYINGNLVASGNGLSDRPITVIEIGRYLGTPTAFYSDLNVNYFAITRGIKYSTNFNPDTDTGFNSLFYDANANTQYCN